MENIIEMQMGNIGLTQIDNTYWYNMQGTDASTLFGKKVRCAYFAHIRCKDGYAIGKSKTQLIEFADGTFGLNNGNGTYTTCTLIEGLNTLFTQYISLE